MTFETCLQNSIIMVLYMYLVHLYTNSGHYLTSKNTEGLHDTKRLVDVEIMESPSEVFQKDGCITFWYYLNTTDVRPISTAAQILVYLKYHDLVEKPKLLW